MFKFSVSIGIYSYLIFFLGITGQLFKNHIFIVSLLYWVFFIFYFFKPGQVIFLNKKVINRISAVCIFLLGVMFVVNLVGVLGPEISFDALWYHLTLPKLYLINHAVFHIPGSLLYYSDMPKLTEMIYVAALSFGDEFFAKLIHFTFGVLILFPIYKISRKFFSQELSLLATLIFYSNLVVGWESMASYSDLSRTFFEIMGFWAFIKAYEIKSKKWLLYSGALLGFAISAKLLATGSILIFICLLVIFFSKSFKDFLVNFISLTLPAVIIPLPWFIFSYINTGNPIYPFFDSRINLQLQDSSNLIEKILNIFLFSSDPISPVYLIVLPILFFLFKNASAKVRLLYIYSLGALIILLLTPNIGGGRFILAYLPVFSILAIYALRIQINLAKSILLLIIFLIIFSSIGYRFLANFKFVPVIVGNETKAEFLSNHLNFKFGDFYDTDSFFKNNIYKSDKVLLYGFHNLYYVNFPFIHSSWIKKGDKFNYIAFQDSKLPKRFLSWELVYYNKITGVKPYSNKKQLCTY
ncbi:MAG: hypothetical protein A3B38_01715 [Candidatus Levybacteria bacterium RIFCSPLOWO2_01_FULL_36_13]|nr:MAG: hypothetical protein A2684_02950 [Candidatus Levybacteria bacterium RIFCSPHIGHO2_01_FULL_36_15b]OGH35581.1 MAG: hypothetical protein A3B38_01715 [Candidatus Levybacteria bacterium RIFCSPLOWO2_01_FULL_36_13]